MTALDWDRQLLDAQLVATEQRIADLERTATWLRGLLEVAEQAQDAHRAELAELDRRILDVRRSCTGRTATAEEFAEHERLEGLHQRAQDRFRAWVWDQSAVFEDRARVGTARSWSTRWSDDVRGRLLGVGDELQRLDVERDRLLSESAALAPVVADRPSDEQEPRSWRDRLLGG